MNTALSTLGLQENQLTTENLKSAFKAAALRSHPDRGGADFDTVLNAYLYLSQIIRRQTGGRDGLAILDPREVEQARQEQFERELNNMVVEVMEVMNRESGETKIGVDAQFHAAFERLHVSEQRGGYGQWMKGKAVTELEMDSVVFDREERYQRFMRDPYASQWLKGESVPVMATTKTIDHKAFEETYPAAAGTMILHLSEMATFSRPTGTLLTEDGLGFHSVGEKMNYTDLHAAYDVDSIIRNKLPPESVAAVVPTLEEVMAARESSIAAPQTDVEMQEIAAYEIRRKALDDAHQMRITDYFAAAPSSQWALPRTKDDSFIKTL